MHRRRRIVDRRSSTCVYLVLTGLCQLRMLGCVPFLLGWSPLVELSQIVLCKIACFFHPFVCENFRFEWWFLWRQTNDDVYFWRLDHVADSNKWYLLQTAWQFNSTKCLGMIVKICAGCPTFIIFVEEFRMSSCCTGKGRHVDLFDECSFQLQKKINCH